MFNKTILTFDIDWAPDFVINYIADTLEKKSVRSTWFITHHSKAIERLKQKKELYEVGIHPNFSERSTHGNSIEEVINTMINIVPDAAVSRNHSTMQSGQILSDLVRLTSIRIDSSIFLPEMPNIIPVIHLTPNGKLIRVPFFWADDYELLKDSSDWSFNTYKLIPGLKLFLFHPIHIYLNSRSLKEYSEFKSKYPDISNIHKYTLDNHVYEGKGVCSMFDDIISFLSNNGSSFITENV